MIHRKIIEELWDGDHQTKVTTHVVTDSERLRAVTLRWENEHAPTLGVHSPEAGPRASCQFIKSGECCFVELNASDAEKIALRENGLLFAGGKSVPIWETVFEYLEFLYRERYPD